MQELVDIYIKPAAAPVSALGSVGRDATVPSGERKIVFSGLESLFSFHKESFLPALERVTTPIMRPAAELAEADSDGHVSLDTARAVATLYTDPPNEVATPAPLSARVMPTPPAEVISVNALPPAAANTQQMSKNAIERIE